MARILSLNAIEFARLQRFGEAVHEAFRREVQQLGLGLAALHFPGDGVQEVGLAEADLRMEIERVVAQRMIGDRFGHLKRGGMGKPVRRAYDKGREGEASFQRRSFETIPTGAAIAQGGFFDARGSRLGRLELGRDAFRTAALRKCGLMRLTHAELEPVDIGQFGAAARQQAIGIVRLQPVAQEFRRDGHMNGSAVARFEFHPTKPAGENVFAKLGAQPRLNPPPFAINGIGA